MGASTTSLRVPFAVSTVHWNMNKYNRIITGIKTGDIKDSLACGGKLYFTLF